MRRRALLALVSAVSVGSGCLAGAPEATESTPTTETATPPAGDVQRRVSLAAVDSVDDDHDVAIDAELTTDWVTDSQPARVHVTTTNEGQERKLSISEDGCSLFNRERGQSSPRGLWLYSPEIAAQFEREDSRWRRPIADEGTACQHGSAQYACSPRGYESGDSLTNEYVVWADSCVDGYMEPDSYRWEETVYVYDADAELGDEPTAEFDWGFSLRVDHP